MFRLRTTAIVNFTLIVLFSISEGRNDVNSIDLRNIGIPVHFQTTPGSGTLMFEDILKAYTTTSKQSYASSFMDAFKATDQLGLPEYCKLDALLLYNRLDTTNQTASVTYIDAAAKIPFGILQGKWNWVGDYQECLSIESVLNPQTNKSFKGEYFSVSVVLNGKPVLMETYPVVLGVCLPDSCGEADVKTFANKLIQNLQSEAHTIYPPIANQSLSVYEVISDEPKSLDSGAITVLTISGIIGLIITLATLVDYWSSSFAKETLQNIEDDNIDMNSSDRTGLLSGELFSPTVQEGTLYGVKQKMLDLCRVFSVFSNGKKLLGTSTAVGPLACLNGIRVLSMWWVILDHTYAFILQVVDNILEAATLIQRFTFQPIVNGTFSVDSFFFLSGLLVAYLALKEIREKGRLNWPYYFLHRYWRLTPLYGFIILYYTYVFVNTISGPMTFMVRADAFKDTFDVCKTYWWTNLLYINNMYPNYGNLGTTCMGWSWYLANDMQFYLVLGPLVIVTLSLRDRLKYIGISLTSFLILAGVVIRGCLVWYYGIYDELSGQPTKHVDDPWGKNGPLYARPYARWSVYLVGMLTGYVLASCNNRIKLHKAVAVGGWCVAIATAMAVIFGQYHYNSHPGTHMTMVESIFYISLSRTAWSLCLAWVVVACVSGNGGPVRDVLSWKMWAPLGRLTYAAYLVHPIVIFTYYYNVPQPIHYSDFNMVYLFISNLVLSYLAAFIVSMLVEAPMIQLEKLLIPSLAAFNRTYLLGFLRWMGVKMMACFNKLR